MSPEQTVTVNWAVDSVTSSAERHLISFDNQTATLAIPCRQGAACLAARLQRFSQVTHHKVSSRVCVNTTVVFCYRMSPFLQCSVECCPARVEKKRWMVWSSRHQSPVLLLLCNCNTLIAKQQQWSTQQLHSRTVVQISALWGLQEMLTRHWRIATDHSEC